MTSTKELQGREVGTAFFLQAPESVQFGVVLLDTGQITLAVREELGIWTHMGIDRWILSDALVERWFSVADSFALVLVQEWWYHFEGVKELPYGAAIRTEPVDS